MKRQGIVRTKQVLDNHYGCDPYNTVDAVDLRIKIRRVMRYVKHSEDTFGRPYSCAPCRAYEEVTSC